MESSEYRTLIEKMGPRENIINHIDNILDLLIPGGRVGLLHIGPGEWPHCRELGVEVAEWISQSMALQQSLEPSLRNDLREGRNLVRV